jgi:hypothetical protein
MLPEDSRDRNARRQILKQPEQRSSFFVSGNNRPDLPSRTNPRPETILPNRSALSAIPYFLGCGKQVSHKLYGIFPTAQGKTPTGLHGYQSVSFEILQTTNFAETLTLQPRLAPFADLKPSSYDPYPHS